ncbi:unnamed protein product, partial [Prorocentrum cordatum]
EQPGAAAAVLQRAEEERARSPLVQLLGLEGGLRTEDGRVAGACSTGETHAKKHPACLQGALGFVGFDGSAMANAACPHQKSTDVLGSQGWFSRGRFLVVELLRYSRSVGRIARFAPPRAATGAQGAAPRRLSRGCDCFCSMRLFRDCHLLLSR